MAKGQKKSNREIRKPKQEKPKTESVARSFLAGADRNAGSPAAKKSAR
jgi:hypothetical protein